MANKIAAFALTLILFGCGGGIDRAENNAEMTDTAGPECASAPDGEITIASPWIRATGAGVARSAAYFTICNQLDVDVSLISVETEIAPSALHKTTRDADGVVSMGPLDAIAIPARGSAILGPGGAHLMLSGLVKPIAEGDLIMLVIGFDNGSFLNAEAVAISPTAAGTQRRR